MLNRSLSYCPESGRRSSTGTCNRSQHILTTSRRLKQSLASHIYGVCGTFFLVDNSDVASSRSKLRCYRPVVLKVRAPFSHVIFSPKTTPITMKTLIYRVNSSCSRSRASVFAVRCIRYSQRRLTSTESAGKPLSAGGELPGVANSKILRTTRDAALKTPGIRWMDDAESPSPDGGRETRKMNMYQAVSL